MELWRPSDSPMTFKIEHSPRRLGVEPKVSQIPKFGWGPPTAWPRAEPQFPPFIHFQALCVGLRLLLDLGSIASCQCDLGQVIPCLWTSVFLIVKRHITCLPTLRIK